MPGVEVLAASVPQDYLARLRASLTAGDCPPSAIGLRSLALWRLWSQTYAPQAESVATLLEVGRSHSEIIITAGGRLLACRSVPVGWASQADHGDENPVDAIPMAESKTPDVIADNDSPDREDSLVGTSRTGLDFEKVPQTAAATAPDTTQGRSAPDPDTHKPDPQRWMAMLSAEVRRTLLAVSARHGSPLSVELHLLAGVEYRQAFAEHLGQTGFGVTALAPESQIAVRESARGVMSRGHHGALVGLCHQMLGDGGLPLDYQKPKIEEAERQLAEASRLRRLLIALAAVIALVAPLPFYMKARAELATRETTLAEYQRRTKDARQDAQKFKIFRAIWSDKPEGAVPAPLFDKVQAERKTLAVIKEQMAQRAALADDAQRASDTVAVVSGKLAVARYAGINRALAEVYTAADTAFGWGNGGLRGELLEFRLEPTPRSSLAGRAATSAEQASARVVVKGRADSSATAQRLADELTAGGGAVTALSMLPVNNPRERERRAVEFELRYQPQYKPGLVSPEALWDAARRAAIAKAAKPDPKMVAKPQTKTATKPNPTTALVASPENPASAKR